MTEVPRFTASRRTIARSRLSRSVSVGAVIAGLLATPAQAQLARIRGGFSATPSATAGAALPGAPTRSVSMREALAAQKTAFQQAADIRAYITTARQAAVADRSKITVTNGISVNGLYPVLNIRQAMAAATGGDTTTSGALLVAARAANDPTGKATWDGAGLPTETVKDGTTTVDIVQNQSRALLSWNSFNIGANTTLNFSQKVGTLAQPDWIAVNRVVDSVNPTLILGSLNADGQIYVLNSAGVIFGKGSQTNLRSLVASSLELGNYAPTSNGNLQTTTVSTLQQRTFSFLQSGPLSSAVNGKLSQTTPPTPPLLLSPLVESGTFSTQGGLEHRVLPKPEGDVIVDPGATVTAGKGGSIILAAPLVQNSGILSATEGQVSLVGGRLIAFTQLTGEASSLDPNIRGLFLRSVTSLDIDPAQASDPLRDGGTVVNTGLIESTRGYLSLVTSETGTVTNSGLLAATTSVSRNGKVALYGLHVNLSGGAAGQAGAITILPDETGETIPQGSPAQPANFKRSQIEIGTLVPNLSAANQNTDGFGIRAATNFAMGDNAFVYAPNANFVAADAPGATGSASRSVTIGAGATIDVSGLKDVAVDSSRNFVTVTPVKRNELRDTPNYREVAIGDNFTLNGTALTVDIRRTGVRADGVHWVGSPLIEAGSIASQIPVTVSELMTTGGDVELTGLGRTTAGFALGDNAKIDFSGGWVSYGGGTVGTSKLVTSDGRIVDIGNADPNDRFTAVLSGFSDKQPRFGVDNVYANPTVSGSTFENAYDEGRDAGSLRVSANTSSVRGALIGNAFAGARQVATATPATPATAASTIAGDTRKLQSARTELPAGGFVSLDAGVIGGADFVVYHGVLGTTPTSLGQSLLNDDMLSAAGLSGLSLQTSGAVTFGGGSTDTLNLFLTPGTNAGDLLTLNGASTLTLAPGGALNIVAGRAIRFDGRVVAAGGTVDARTFANTANGGINIETLQGGLRPDDDISLLYAVGSALPRPFDITVNGTISTAGLWVNDYRDGVSSAYGRAWKNGGTIRLTAAPNLLVALGPSLAAAQSAGDLSGSIDINAGALLDVSAGGFVNIDQSVDLTGRGGNVSLIESTNYAAIVQTQRTAGSENPFFGDSPLYGSNQTVGFTPLSPDATYSQALLPSLVPNPEDVRAHVAIAGSIAGFGFTTGGTFTLVSPDITFGSDTSRPAATHIGLDFAATTGFGTIDLSSLRSTIVPHLFSNGTDYNSAFLTTSSFFVRAGETLDLTQSLFPLITARADVDSLLTLETGASLRSLAALKPVVPTAAFDRAPVNFVTGGLTEVVVESGGTITGAAQASITAAKLVNAGTINLPGGAVRERYALGSRTALLQGQTVAVRVLADAFGPADTNGQFDEMGTSALGGTNAALFTNVGTDRYVTLLGVADENVGIDLRPGSVTDLSGTALFDPRARFINDRATGALRQALTGRIIDGGVLSTASAVVDPAGGAPAQSRMLVAEPGAKIDLSGTTAVIEQFVAGQGYVGTTEWSRGGTLSALGGGSIAGAFINAFGGYGDDGGAFAASGQIDTSLARPEAEGGKLEWLRPTLAQVDPDTTTFNTLYAGSIGVQGFDTLIARNGLVFSGAVNLALDKALLVTANVVGSGSLNPTNSYYVAALPGADARVSAPYIAFKSLANRADNDTLAALKVAAPDAPATVEFTSTLGIDFFGSAYFDKSISTLSFRTPGDLRFIGVDGRLPQSVASPTLSGAFGSSADTLFDAGRVYATTGTGNLQAFLDAQAQGTAVSNDYTPYLVSAAGDHAITIGGSYINRATPLSAGSYLKLAAARIEQDGHLAAPMGRLELGSNVADLSGKFGATQSLVFGAGSLTTLSGAGASVGGVTTQVPYGTTLDLIEYYFSPLAQTPLKTVPNSLLTLNGQTIDVNEGATLDLKGGGGIFAYEFVSGVGGSRDVLDRFNTDSFSSNRYDPGTGTGYQFADGRQVYTIIPKSDFNGLAPYDPIYSANYGESSPADLYGTSAGQTVRLDGTADIPAGDYVLLPAHYALLPGITAYRLVENVGAAAPAVGTSTTLLDGSLIVGGTYGFAGTGISDSTRRSFTLASKAVFSKASRIETTSGAGSIAAAAAHSGKVRPRLPLDAARLIISPLLELKIAGFFDTTTPDGGRGLQVDVGGTNIVIASGQGAAPPAIANSLTLFDTTLQRLNADSLFIGGFRVDNGDGTTDLRISANTLTVGGGVDLAAPELILATGNGYFGSSSLTIADGATLRATGTLADPTTTDYIVPSYLSPPAGYQGDTSGAGSVVRVANGPERLISRTGDAASTETLSTATLTIGAATLAGQSVALDTSRNFTISDGATLTAGNLALSGDSIAFDGVFIAPRLLATLEAAQRLTIKSSAAITMASGTYAFNDLVIDAPALRAINATRRTVPTDVVITADTLRWSNSGATLPPCSQALCGRGDIGTSKPVETLSVTADSIAFGSGQIRALGFRDDVTLTARQGIFYEGIGGLDVGLARLTLATPVIADRAAIADPRAQKLRPDFTLASTGGITVDGGASGGMAIAAIAGNRAPGAHLTFQTSAAKVPVDQDVLDITVNNATLVATAGTIDIRSERNLTVSGNAILATPGYTKSFGDALDSVTVAASGGTIHLVAPKAIDLQPGTTLISDTGIGNAGKIDLLSPSGTINFGASLNPGLAGSRLGSFTFDSGVSAFDLAGFLDTPGRLFGGDVSVRSGAGDLLIDSAQVLKATSVSLTADGGKVAVAGTIDTSGIDVTGMTLADASNARVAGGSIDLFGKAGVALAATARLDTHTSGYAALDARSAHAGDVTIGIGSAPGAAIVIADGAVIDASAGRTQAAIAAGLTKDTGRFVAETAKEPGTLADRTVYRFVEADTGGIVTLRAPLIGTALDQVDIRLSSNSAFVGADRLQIAGVRTYDLNALVGRPGIAAGVDPGDVVLDPSANYLAGNAYAGNILSGDFVTAKGLPSISHFVRNFTVGAVDGTTSFTGFELRPGVDLVATGAISLDSNWNLAAAQIDETAAFRAGLLDKIIPLGLRDEGYGLLTKGKPYFSVKTGAEAALLEGVAGTAYKGANFYYRVGGKASGEAPIVTFRAGGDVTISRSINDGFFVFRDKSDPAYTNYQMGGGDRVFSPAVAITCGTFGDPSCTSVVSYDTPVLPFERNALAVRINLGQIERGATEFYPSIFSPLSAEANSPAALGTARDMVTKAPAGASLEFGELFPLLSGGVAMHSSDIAITAGADAQLSANPLHVDVTRNASVRVWDGVVGRNGEPQRVDYQLKVKRGNVILSGNDLKLATVTPYPGDGYSDQDLQAFVGTDQYPIDGLTPDSLGILNWGTEQNGANAFATDPNGANALEYFKGRKFIGRPASPIGVVAPLSQIIAFLNANKRGLLKAVAQGNIRVAPTAPDAPYSFPGYAQAQVQTTVRTGDGAIHIAAATDVDLRDGKTAFLRKSNGQKAAPGAGDGYQVGGTSVYTAGQRVSGAPLTGLFADGSVGTVVPTSALLVAKPEDTTKGPSINQISNNAPVLSRNGGNVAIAAGRDVLGRFDVWSEAYRRTLSRDPANLTLPSNRTAGKAIEPGLIDQDIGAFDQLWRPGTIGPDTELGIAAEYFTSGVGALAGGDVTITAGRNVSDLTVALDTSVTSEVLGTTKALLTFGGGNLDLTAGNSILSGRYDITAGQARVAAGRSVDTLTETLVDPDGGRPTVAPVGAKFRLENATVDLRAGNLIDSVAAYGLGTRHNAGLFTPVTSFSATALGDVSFTHAYLAPPSLGLASLQGSVGFVKAPQVASVLPDQYTTLYPSTIGQLSILSAGDIGNFAIAMLDLDPSLLKQSAFASGVDLRPPEAGVGGSAGYLGDAAANFPGVNPTVSEATRRQQHNNLITHRDDFQPARIFTDGSLTNVSINLAKQASVIAGEDIVDTYFVGQNVRPGDQTRIAAGRDIVATQSASTLVVGTGFQAVLTTLPNFNASSFYLGGPGTFSVSAGRDIGPFITSATLPDGTTYGGGILTVGNEYNPWLTAKGADLDVLFGVAPGIDYATLRQTYLNPALSAGLDGDLFVQVADTQGNLSPDRTRPIYAPILAKWLRDHAPDAFAAIFGAAYSGSDDALTTAAYGKAQALYDAFAALDAKTQTPFLVNKLYFNELEQASLPTSPSYQQYVRGYRAVEALFPTRLGYTDNLAPYTTDPSTVNADHPLGVPRRNIVNGQPEVAKQVVIGNADLRFATLQTARGGDITIMGPGGDFLAGSVVRTSEQPRRRFTRFVVPDGILATKNIEFGGTGPFDPGVENYTSSIAAIPLGYEGVLTLRTGTIRYFSDGDLRLNQSRVFTNAVGDISAWSSNGDLNAGQGPKSSANFPPVTVRFDLNGFPAVDTAGGISGAGIGAFKQSPTDPDSRIILIAPVGEVDAGDAGVRATGDVFVAAARVANADNFSAGGTLSGVPSGAIAAAPAVPPGAGSALQANLASVRDNSANKDRESVISVDILGFAGGDRCLDPNNTDANCPR